MLAKQRRPAPDVRGRVAHLDRGSERTNWTERRLIHVYDHLSRADLSIRKDLRVVVDRSARDLAGFEERQPVIAGTLDRDRFNLPVKRVEMPVAPRVVGKLRVGAPFGVTEYFANPSKDALFGAAERHVTVATLDRLVRRIHPVRGAQRRGDTDA